MVFSARDNEAEKEQRLTRVRVSAILSFPRTSGISVTREVFSVCPSGNEALPKAALQPRSVFRAPRPHAVKHSDKGHRLRAYTASRACLSLFELGASGLCICCGGLWVPLDYLARLDFS